MRTRGTVSRTNVSSLGTLSDLLDLLAQLGKLDQPLTTPEGLRSAIELLSRLGALLGVDADWLAWLESVLESPAVFNLVLAGLNYLLSIIEPAQPAPPKNDRAPNGGSPFTAQAFPIAVWLSLFAEIAQFLQKLRAKQ